MNGTECLRTRAMYTLQSLWTMARERCCPRTAAFDSTRRAVQLPADLAA
jgi:hypothetical protein